MRCSEFVNRDHELDFSDLQPLITLPNGVQVLIGDYTRTFTTTFHLHTSIATAPKLTKMSSFQKPEKDFGEGPVCTPFTSSTRHISALSAVARRSAQRRVSRIVLTPDA